MHYELHTIVITLAFFVCLVCGSLCFSIDINVDLIYSIHCNNPNDFIGLASACGNHNFDIEYLHKSIQLPWNKSFQKRVKVKIWNNLTVTQTTFWPSNKSILSKQFVYLSKIQNIGNMLSSSTGCHHC